MNLFPILLLFVSIIFIESKEVRLPHEGSYTIPLKSDSIGLARSLTVVEAEEFLYFCENATGDRKKNCGAWVDKRGEKSARVGKLKVTKSSVVMDKLVWTDSGKYGVLPEDKNAKKAEAARVELYIEQLPLNGK